MALTMKAIMLFAYLGAIAVGVLAIATWPLENATQHVIALVCSVLCVLILASLAAVADALLALVGSKQWR